MEKIKDHWQTLLIFVFLGAVAWARKFGTEVSFLITLAITTAILIGLAVWYTVE